jgi:hypothetical protein
MDKDKEPIKQLYKKVYKEYSTKFIKFFTWEKVTPDAEYKKEPKRRTQTRP